MIEEHYFENFLIRFTENVQKLLSAILGLKIFPDKFGEKEQDKRLSRSFT